MNKTLFKFSDHADQQVDVYRRTFAILQSNHNHVNPISLIRHSTNLINLITCIPYSLRIRTVPILCLKAFRNVLNFV